MGNWSFAYTRYDQSEDHFCAAESAAATLQSSASLTFNHFTFMLLPDKVPDAARDEEVPSQEPPPYSLTQTQSTSAIPSAVNFVSVTRRDRAIRDTFAINPRILIPSSLLPPLADGESGADRANLRLECWDGSIDAEVWLVTDGPGDEHGSGSKGRQTLQRTTLILNSKDGSVKSKIHTIGSNPRHPFHLTASTRDGSITIHLPRSFQGPLTINIRDGSLTPSESLKARLTTFSETKGTRRCFVGDFTGWLESESRTGAGWNGDEVVVNCRDGGVRLLYEDEEVPKFSLGGFWNQVFRM